MIKGPFKNTVLQHLDEDVTYRLQLHPVELPVNRDMEEPGCPIANLYFVESGIGSMTSMFRDGMQVEVSMFGYESVVGVSALMGTRRSLNRIFMQLGGHGFASPVEAATREFARGEAFHDVALRYVQAQLTQSTQNAACNAVHTNEQRLARWLLICSDRSQETHFKISQEFVSEMLGSTRSTVSITVNVFKEKGLIEHRRGNIEIVDRAGLERQACECYGVIREHLENYLEFDTGFVV